jgi:hypothetical protein
MNATQIRHKLAGLDERLADARERVQHLRAEARAYWKVPDAVLAELGDYHRDVLVRRRAADPAEARRLSRELCERVIRDGLVIEPTDPCRPAAGLRVTDPSRLAAAEAAQTVATEVQRERDELAARHAELLDRDAKRTRMAAIRDALQGDDPDALRAALLDAEDHGPGALTTADLELAPTASRRGQVAGSADAADATARIAAAQASR